MKQAFFLVFLLNSLFSFCQHDRFSGKLEFKENAAITGSFYTGQFSVPEDRISLIGKSIELNIVVLPAIGRSEPDPVFILTGPLALTDEIDFFANDMPELRNERDIILIDQRGSWNSNPLDCSLPRYVNSIYNYQDQKTFAKNIGRTLREVQSKGAPQNYTNAQVADDLEAVRQWLGYDRINLWASGLGTITARAYLFKYAEQVRTLTMQSVRPVDVSTWNYTQRSARQRLNEIFKACTADSSCHSRYPELSEHFGLLYDRLTNLVEYTDLLKDDGTYTKIGIDQHVLEQIIQRQMMSATESSLIPWIVESAYHGDMDVLAQRAEIGKRDVPLGTYLCLACNEDPIHKDPRAIVPDKATPFDAFFQKKEVDFCRVWPTTETELTYMRPFDTDVPTLILSGSVDHTSPPGIAGQVNADFKNGKQIVLLGRGSKDIDACTIDLITEMIEEGSSKSLNSKCSEVPLSVPFYIP